MESPLTLKKNVAAGFRISSFSARSRAPDDHQQVRGARLHLFAAKRGSRRLVRSSNGTGDEISMSNDDVSMSMRSSFE